MKTAAILALSACWSLCAVSLPAADTVVTLEQAVRQARERSLVLKQAEEQVKAAEARAREAKTYLYPALGFSGTYAWQSGKTAPDVVNTEFDNNNLSLTVSQPVYTGQRLQKEYESAVISADLARTAYDQTEADLVFHVDTAYFAALRLEKSVAVAGELVNNRRRHLSEVEKRVQVGILPKVEQLKAEVGLAHSQDLLFSAENSFRFSRCELNRLLEIPIDNPLALEETTADTGAALAALSYYYDRALQSRPEVKIARLETVQAEKGISIARSAYYPQVSLQLTRQEIQSDAFGSGWNDNNQASVVLSYDIWNWNRNRERVNSSQNQLAQARFNRLSVERNVALEVKNAYLAVSSAQARILTAERAISQAEEALKMQTVRFREGMATNTDVLDADFALSQTKNDYYNAVYDFLQAKTALNKSTGQLK